MLTYAEHSQGFIGKKALEALPMAITQDRPVKVFNPKTPRVTLIAIALLTGSAIGLNLVRDRQIQKIEQAQTILTQACTTNLSTNPQGTAQQIDSATQLLRSVPPVPGLGHRLAQAELADSAPCIQRVRSTANLQQAQTLSAPALETTATTVLSTQEWQTLQTNLDAAIVLLRAIPPSAAVYPQAQEQLNINQAKSTEITARIQTEAGAANAYLRAVGLIQQADQLAATPTQGNLLAAEGNVQEAIRLIESVPEGTTIFDSRSVTLETYRSKLTDIQTQWLTQQLQPLVESFQSFATSLETDIGYESYLTKWSALKQQFETQTQGSEITRNHPVTQTLSIAVQNYDDALTVWRYCHEDNCYTSFQAGFFLDSPSISWLPETLPLQGRTLDQTYTIDSTYSLIRQGRFVQLNNTLREIWRTAEAKVEQAKEQL
jgi:hypothetical protein